MSGKLSRRQIACLQVMRDGVLHLDDGRDVRTARSLEARGLAERKPGYVITPLGRGALLDHGIPATSGARQEPPTGPRSAG